jgi:putative membrane protein
MLNRTLLLAALLGLAAFVGTSRTFAADEDRSNLTDQGFVTQASADGLAELDLARLALQKSQNPEVRKFAQRMIDDHTKANRELNSVADRNQLRPAPQAGEKHRQLMERLSRLQGADFDRGYAEAMAKDHDEAVSLFERACKDCKQKDLKDFADKTISTLKEHKEMAHKLADKVGGKEGSDTGKEKSSKDRDKDRDKDR